MTPGLLLGVIGISMSIMGIAACLPRRRDGSGHRSAVVRVSRPGGPSSELVVSSSSLVGPVGRPAAAALVAGVLTGVVTRWPAAAVLAGAAGAGVPALLGSTGSRVTTERVEAIATWTELLRDTLAAAAGLGQAITATAELSPFPIRREVQGLADRLTGGVPMEEALRTLAAELADPTADLVVCALLVAARAQSQKLGDLLGALAESCREEVAMRLRVEASRASSRSSVRTVVLFSLGFAGLLFALARSYLAPFGSATGQLVLLVVGGCYAGGLVLMVRLVRARPAARLLGSERVA